MITVRTTLYQTVHRVEELEIGYLSLRIASAPSYRATLLLRLAYASHEVE